MNVIMSTHHGHYKQVDGLAMGSPPAPYLANIWLSKFDPVIQACMNGTWMTLLLSPKKK